MPLLGIILPLPVRMRVPSRGPLARLLRVGVARAASDRGRGGGFGGAVIIVKLADIAAKEAGPKAAPGLLALRGARGRLLR